jgi:hypothetical protein
MKLKYVDKIRANISINASKKSTHLLDGLYRSIFKGRSMDFDDLRDYVVGDNSKDIDWKSSIRHGSLLVRRYVALKRHNIAFIIDTGVKMSGLNPNNEEKRETALYTFGTLAYLVNKNEDEISTTYNKEGSIFSSQFKGGLTNVEISLTEIEKYLTDENPYTINDLIEYVYNNSKRKMIFVVISDINGLINIKDDLLKKISGAHDLLFINIEDASMFGDDLYDLDSSLNIPRILSKNKKILELEEKKKNELIKSNFKRLEKYRITSVSIKNKSEIVSKLIDLLERHNHAVGR